MDAQQRGAEAEAERCRDHGADPERVARGRRLLLNDEMFALLAETFRTLADSTRAKIVYSLLHQELCTCDLAALTGVSEAAASQHLKMLRQLRVVKSRREGKLVYYSLDDSHVRDLLTVALSHFEHESAPEPGTDAPAPEARLGLRALDANARRPASP